MKKWFSFILALCAVSGCSSAEEGSSIPPKVSDTAASSLSDYNFEDSSNLFSNECEITLGSTVSINGDGAWFDDNHVTISEGGIYTVSGELDDGQITVESSDPVKLVLNGAAILNDGGAAIKSGEGKLIIECTEGTENRLVSTGDKKEAINCDGELIMKHGAVTIVSEGGGIKSKTSFAANSIALDISTDSSSEEEPRGIKAKEITLSDCTVAIDSKGHGIKSDGKMTVSGGSFNISSHNGKGMSSDGELLISGADIAIPLCEEGIESKSTMTIDGGNISITANDDGFNTGGEAGSDNTMNILNGNITINSGNDGLDSNGDINISGGTIVIYGSEKEPECAVDCGEGFGINISGGKVFAFGAAGMTPVSDGYKIYRISGSKKGDIISVTDENGNELFSAELPKSAETALVGGSGYKGFALSVNGKAAEEASYFQNQGKGNMPPKPGNGAMPQRPDDNNKPKKPF